MDSCGVPLLFLQGVGMKKVQIKSWESLFDTIFVVFDTFIRPDLFGSLTENDATGGADMDRPTRDFCREKCRF